MNIQKKVSNIIVLILCLFLSSTSCERDRYVFPYVPINLNVSLVQLDAEIGMGEYEYMFDDAGVNGLIIARNYNNQYLVYDRTCTYEQDYSCAVENDTTIQHLYCPCCESQYFLDLSFDDGDAYVTRGPAKYSLKKYSSFINGGFLTIRN